MPSARDIANFFLELGRRSFGEAGSITNLKLQKLLYYAQGYHLAMTGRPLFSERIEAWDHGPVVREVYHECKRFGGNPIPAVQGFDPVVLGEHVCRFVEDVHADRGGFTAWNLREMTHAERPWQEAFVPKQNEEIPIERLQAYFTERFSRELVDLTDSEDEILRELLAEHPNLPIILHLARRELNARFGPDAQMTLRSRIDPEEGDRYAALTVFTARRPEDAAALRDAFDAAWWLDRAGMVPLVINFELV